jgi:pimeloyl-ACP methyl ester carboxylesterase
MHQVVYELHTLLERAGERPPFVLVGHSYGGWLARVYAATYPNEVAGMVLIEGGADDPWRRLPNGHLVRASTLAKGDTIPAVKTAGPLRVSDIPPAALEQIQAAARENAEHPNEPPRDRLPADAQRMRAWALARLGHIVAAVNPSENEELAGLRAGRAKTRYLLGDLPLVVLARGRAEESGADSTALEADHRSGMAAVAAMSRRGRLIIAPRSGHHIQLEQPELVIDAISDVLKAARK